MNKVRAEEEHISKKETEVKNCTTQDKDKENTWRTDIVKGESDSHEPEVSGDKIHREKQRELQQRGSYSTSVDNDIPKRNKGRLDEVIGREHWMRRQQKS